MLLDPQTEQIERLEARIQQLEDSEAAWAYSANGQMIRAEKAEARADRWRQVAHDLAAGHFIPSPELRSEKFNEALDRFAELIREEG